MTTKKKLVTKKPVPAAKKKDVLTPGDTIDPMTGQPMTMPPAMQNKSGPFPIPFAKKPTPTASAKKPAAPKGKASSALAAYWKTHKKGK